jgi:response regulator RpfG family c-di-GMP phosphodiesterase
MFKQMLRRSNSVHSWMMAVPGMSIPSAVEAGKPLQEAQGVMRVTAGRLKRRREDAGTRAHRTCSTKAGEAPTVVVVDDDPSVLRALSRLIQTAGFRVLTFDRPSALIASAIPKADTCLIVDLNLPEMNGAALCSALTVSGRSLPTILITGRNDSATQRLIKGAHTVAVLFKPMDERALFDAIARAFSRSDG